MNNSAKGSRMEGRCLDEAIKHFGYENIVVAWKTYRSRKGGNDLFGDSSIGITGFDLGILYDKRIIFVQVDDAFMLSRWENLKLNWHDRKDIESYYAVYNHKPRIFNEKDKRNFIKLPSFYLMRV